MSYPSVNNYGNYYDSSQSQQNTSNSYNTPRPTGSTTSYSTQKSYPGDIGQSRYSSSGYDWSNQPQQQNYPSNSRQQTTYGNDAWSDATAQTTGHEERTQASNYAAAAAKGALGHNYYGSSTSTSQNTQGLNNLAYASGLDGAGMQRHGQHTQRSKTPSASGYSSAFAAHGSNRVQSPITTHGTSRYNTAPSNTNFTYQNEDSSSQTQGNSLSAAAAALAGAVSARFSQASAAMGHPSSASPVMDTSASMHHAAPQRTSSPYQPAQSAKAQAQRRQSSSTQQTNHKPSNAIAYQQSPPPAKSGQHNRTPSQPVAQQGSQTQTLPVNSISNLVTPSIEEPAQSQYPAAGESQSMPSYIDPTQVFNPYAKEHERRRREAAAQAEVDARRKEAEEEAATKQKAEEAMAAAAEKKRVEEAAVAKRREQNAAAAARKANASQQNKAAKKPAAPQSQPADTTSPQLSFDQTMTDSAPGATDMASELKAMMEKMQEFRTKDPSLFQKLWEDMRKPNSGPSTAVLLHSPSPQMSAPQTLPQAGQPPATDAAPAPPQQLQVTTQATPVQPPAKRSRRSEVPAEVPFGARANGYKVVVEGNPVGLPDLGRFPAERRVRKPHAQRSSDNTETPAQSTARHTYTQPAAASQMPSAPGQAGPAPAPATESQASVTAETLPESVPTLTQGLPPRGPAGGTTWPEEKRNALAEAAVKSLKAIPENSAIEIVPNDIHAMLEQNPSYIDLCELLEKKGLRFHRGNFARQLLSNVPYLNGPHGKPLTPASAQATLLSQSSPSMQGPASQHQPNGKPLIHAEHIPPTANPSVPPNARFQTVNGATNGSVIKPERPLFGQYSASLPRPRPGKTHPSARPEPPPGSKEAMARKRDFSELVDLTALSDNDDYVMSRKQARVESPSPEPIDPFQQFQSQARQSPASGKYPPHGHSLPMQNEMTGPLLFDPNRRQFLQGYAPLPHYPPQAQPFRPAPMPSQLPPQQRAKNFAEPVNKHEALRKTYYDAKTVARDLLIAAGRHPTERPLNAHLAGLLGKHVDIDSDLDTFDWDAIDPGGPPVPQVAYADVPMEPPRFAWGQPGVRRLKLQAPSAPASEPETHPARLPNLDKRHVPAPTSAAAPLTSGVVVSTRQREEKPTSDKAQSPLALVQISTDVGLSQVVPRARGRPRKSEQTTPTSIVPQKPRAIATASPRASPVSQQRLPDSTQLSPTVAPTINSAKKMDSARSFPSGKRVGRPPGSKNLHPSFGAMKKAAAQFTQVEVSVPTTATTPNNPVFKCRWKGCQAHLHNLETIRNHVAKVHCPTGEHLKDQNGYVCWWKKCRLLVEDGDGKLGPSQIFDNKKDWLAHIEEAHFGDLAQRLGDGPSLKHIGKQASSGASFPFDLAKFSFKPLPALGSPTSSSPAPVARTFSHTDPQTILQDRTRYLSDSHGRITTPDVSATSTQKDLEPDSLNLLNADHHIHEEQAQRAFMKTHRQEKSSPRAVAEETLKAMSAKKAKIGAGIDRGGCILVNEETRKTLIQNPGIQRVVDGDY